MENPVRLQKFLALSGLDSRRKCAFYIQKGQVKVNGRVQKEPWFMIDVNKDHIICQGKKVFVKPKIYLMLNKPANCVTTVSDPEGRKTVMDYLKGVNQTVYPVGRLDYDSEGLVLFTNDGELTYKMLHPRFKVEKTYDVLVDRALEDKEQRRIEKGIFFEGKRTMPARLRNVKEFSDGRVIYNITVTEGRKHLVKNLFLAVGSRVKRLKRIKFGPLSIGVLKKGLYRLL